MSAMRQVPARIADEIASYLTREADALDRHPFHQTDPEQAAWLRGLARALEDEYEPFDYANTFSIEGRAPFPHELLKRFSCMPASAQDVERMWSLVRDPDTPVRVALRRKPPPRLVDLLFPYEAAFRAAGWRVVGDGR